MEELSRKVGVMEFDGLCTGLNPAVRVTGRTIKQLGSPATYKRGTLLGAGADGRLEIYNGGPNKPCCILCDTTVVSNDADTVADVYEAGCFDPNKITVAPEYHLTAADLDELRKRSIVFKAAM